MKGLVIGAIIVAAIAVGSAFAQSFDETLDYALANHPRMEQARARLRVAREALPSALAPYRTQITLGGSISTSERDAELSGGATVDDDATPSILSLEASRVIYSGGRRDIALAQARTEFAIAEIDFQIARRDFTLEMTSTMLAMGFSERRLAAREQAMELTLGLVEAVAARRASGAATDTELALANSQHAQSVAELASVRADHQSIRVQLENLTLQPGLDPNIEPPDQDFDELEEAQQIAEEQNLELRRARLQERLARFNAIAAARANSPSASISATRSQSRNTSPAVVSDDETRLSLNVSVPLSTGGGNASNRRRAIAQRSEARSVVRDIEAQLEAQVRQVWIQLLARQTIIAASRSRLNASHTALDGAMAGYESGLWSLVDVFDASSQKVSAELALIDAEERHSELILQLAALTGSANL